MVVYMYKYKYKYIREKETLKWKCNRRAPPAYIRYDIPSYTHSRSKQIENYYYYCYIVYYILALPHSTATRVSTFLFPLSLYSGE